MKKKPKVKPKTEERKPNSSPVCYADSKDIRPEYQDKKEKPDQNFTHKPNGKQN